MKFFHPQCRCSVPDFLPLQTKLVHSGLFYCREYRGLLLGSEIDFSIQRGLMRPSLEIFSRSQRAFPSNHTKLRRASEIRKIFSLQFSFAVFLTPNKMRGRLQWRQTKDSMDHDEIFKTRIHNGNPLAEARAILVLLGFGSLQEFAKTSGINHETASSALGMTEQIARKKRHYNLIAINEALHTAYVETKEKMNRATRSYVCDWAKRWQKESLKDGLMVSGKITSEDKTVLRKRERKRKIIRDSVALAFKRLEWKP